MIRFSLAIVAGLAAPAAAQDEAAAAALIDQALAEQRVFLTCSATMPRSHEFIVNNWQSMRDDAIEVMRDAGWSFGAIATFRARASVGAVMLPPDTPYSEVLALCSAAEDWEMKMNLFEFIILPRELEDLLNN